MKKIKQQTNNNPLDTLILMDKNLIPYIKEKPDALPSAIDYLDDDQKKILLEHFCKLGDLKYVKCLVSNGTDIHSDYENPLCIAIKNGHLDIVKYLVSKGANIHIHYERPLYVTIVHKHVNIAKYLISKGVNPNNLLHSHFKHSLEKLLNK